MRSGDGRKSNSIKTTCVRPQNVNDVICKLKKTSYSIISYPIVVMLSPICSTSYAMLASSRPRLGNLSIDRTERIRVYKRINTVPTTRARAGRQSINQSINVVGLVDSCLAAHCCPRRLRFLQRHALVESQLPHLPNASALLRSQY